MSKPVTSRRKAKVESEFYPTPAWCTRALLAVEEFHGAVWEPACGNGAMAKVLTDAGLSVQHSDIHPRGCGIELDFLTTCGMQEFPNGPLTISNIITNPPNALAEAFVHRALELTTDKVAMFLRLAFLEGQGRYERLFKLHPPARVWVMSERVTMYPAGERTAGSGTTAYAWFVWDRSHTGPTELKWIPPGFREGNG